MVWNKTSEVRVNLILSTLRQDFTKTFRKIAEDLKCSECLVSELWRKNASLEEKRLRYSKINQQAKLGSKNPMFGKTQELHHNSTQVVYVAGYLTEWAPSWWQGLFCKGSRCFVHQRVWCEANGLQAVPKGFVIHHKDHSKFNNNIENLECLSRSEHMKHHAKERATTRAKARREQCSRSAELPKKEDDIV